MYIDAKLERLLQCSVVSRDSGLWRAAFLSRVQGGNCLCVEYVKDLPDRTTIARVDSGPCAAN